MSMTTMSKYSMDYIYDHRIFQSINFRLFMTEMT